MQYRKIKGNDIFTGTDFTGQNKVLITQQDGKIEAIIDEKDAGDDIEVFDGIICPGFINAHCHIELSHLKNKIAPHTGLVNFIEEILKQRLPLDEAQQQAMLAAEMELYDSGTVAVGDICNTTNSIALKKNSKVYWHNFLEVSGFLNSIADERWQSIQTVANDFEKNDLPFSIVPHAPYSVSQQLFEKINSASAKKNISIHNQECADENNFFMHRTGSFLTLYKNLGIDISSFDATQKTSLQSWWPSFNQQQSIILVHNTFTNEEDIALVNNDHYFCICANANQYIEQAVPPINLLHSLNKNIVIGTDSYASNYQLNMLEEIKTIQRVMQSPINFKHILQWATLNGAKALQLDKKLGSFEKNKLPGVVFISNTTASELKNNAVAKRLL
jgi:aminodeoxyfutalosine deaminase